MSTQKGPPTNITAGDVVVDPQQNSPAAPPKKLGTLRFAFVAFCYTAAGPFGIEAVVKEAGPLIAIAIIFLVPLFHCTPIILTLTELSSWMPSNHGEALWVDRAFGHLVGFINAMVGIGSMLVDVSIYPVMTMDYLQKQYFQGQSPEQRWLLTVVLIVLCSIPAFMGMQDVGAIMGAVTVGIMAPFCYGVFAGLPTVDPTAWTGVNDTIDVGKTLSIGIWMFTGYMTIGCFGGEVKSHKVLMKGCYFALFLSIAMYLIPLLVALQVRGSWGDGFLGTAFDVISPGLGHFVSLAAAVSGLALYCTTLASMGRGIWGVADIGFLPKIFTYLHPKTGAPVPAIVFQMVLSAIFAAFEFKFLIVLEMVTSTAMYLMYFMAFIRLRYKEPHGKRKFVVPGGNVFAWILVGPVFVFWCILFVASMAEDWRIDVGFGLLVISIVGIYLKFVRGHENKRFDFEHGASPTFPNASEIPSFEMTAADTGANGRASEHHQGQGSDQQEKGEVEPQNLPKCTPEDDGESRELPLDEEGEGGGTTAN